MRPSRTHGDHIHQGMAVSPLPQGHMQGGQKPSAAACVEPRMEGAAPEGAPAPSCLPCACMPTHVLGLDASQLNAAPALIHAFFLLSLPALGQLPRTEAGEVRAGSRSDDGMPSLAQPQGSACPGRQGRCAQSHNTFTAPKDLYSSSLLLPHAGHIHAFGLSPAGSQGGAVRTPAVVTSPSPP